MHRRRFLQGLAGILASGVAPAVLPSGILMPVRKLWTPSYGFAFQSTFEDAEIVDENLRDVLKAISEDINRIILRRTKK